MPLVSLILHVEAEQTAEEDKVQSNSLFARANAQTSEEILRKYILGGVAWRCLVLLRALGVEVSTYYYSHYYLFTPRNLTE